MSVMLYPCILCVAMLNGSVQFVLCVACLVVFTVMWSELLL